MLIEADSQAAGEAYRAFETWAGADGITVFFAPDTMMAIDQPGRRGFLYDEVYFITIWASHGGDGLLEILARLVGPTDRPWYESSPRPTKRGQTRCSPSCSPTDRPSTRCATSSDRALGEHGARQFARRCPSGTAQRPLPRGLEVIR